MTRGSAVKPRLDALTSLRFVAALLVVVHHAVPALWPVGGLEQLAALGYIGVGFFFVLSGFVLTWSYDDSLSMRHFYGRRFARVYPMHLVTALAAIPVLLWIKADVDAGPAAANVSLLHAWVPVEDWGSSLNGVSWSLSCEAFFYAVFPFAVVWLRRRSPRAALALVGGGLVIVAAVVAVTFPFDVAQQVLYKGPEFRVGEFLIGICLGLLVQGGYRPRIGLPAAAVVAAGGYLAAGVATALAVRMDVDLLRGIPGLIVLPGLCVLIVVAATASLHGRAGWLGHRWALALGEASFALYMTHFLLLQVIGDRTDLSGPVAMAGYVVVAVLVSVAAYRAVERPLERRLRARLGRAPERPEAHVL